MTNSEISEVLREIGIYLEMQDVPFKPRAYEKAAETIQSLEEEVAESYQKKGLKGLTEIPGVGQGIGERIEELLKTGRVKYYEELKKKTPVNLKDFLGVEGLGPKRIKALYQKLKVRTLADLERAAKSGKIAKLTGFGEKSAENILKGIEFVKGRGGRFLLGFIMPEIRRLEERLKKLKEVERLMVAGSVRRRKETIGDADILVISKKPAMVMDYFVSMPDVERVLAHGETKSAVQLKSGLQVDVRVVPEESFGAALNYFTGSKDHNIALREMAIKKGWKLNEYGLFRQMANSKWQMVTGRTEEELYKKLGMDYIEPEMREMTGEIEAALRQAQGKPDGLPKLIGYGDLKGDLQVQTDWTDGAYSIEEMAEAAMERGLEYIAITDHTKRLAMTHGLDEKRIQMQWKEIDGVNKKLSSEGGSASGGKAQNPTFKVLKGTECDILKDGSLDLPDHILSQLDVVGVSVHSLFNMSRKDQTERIKRAMRNPHADILFHPTGRVIQKRPPYEVDMDEIIKTAKETGTILEIDAYPNRLDLKDEYVKKCVEAGVKLSIDSDAHATDHFDFLECGIAQARRGWAERRDIVNAWDVERMLAMLKSGGKK